MCLTLNVSTTFGQGLVELISATNPLLGMNANSLNSNIRFADIDADGDLDGFVGQQNGGIEFYENLGSKTIPAFNKGSYLSVFAPNGHSTIALADLDNDGDYDLVIGDQTGSLDYYE